jgi:hypothetical protein
VNALTGAAIGAGTKLLIDKITGKPVVSGGTSGGTSGSGKTTTPNNPQPNKPVVPNKPVAPNKPAPVTPKAPVTSVTKPADASTTPSADDLYKGTPADPSLGLPAGAIDNGDGTYTVGNTTYSMEDDTRLYVTDADGKIIVSEDAKTTTADNNVVDDTVVDDTVADNTNPEYFQDGDGNYYTLNADGGYDLVYYADGSDPNADTSVDDTYVADNTYVDEATGAVWTMGDNGWTTDFDYDEYYANQDPVLTDDTEYTVADNTDTTDYLDYPPEEEVKRGGLITMMKNGGMPHLAVGGPTNYMPEGAEDNGDGTYTFGNDVFDMETGDPLYTMNDNGDIIYVEPSANSDYVDNGDGTYTSGGITYDAVTDMPLYSDNASGGVDLAKDNGDGTYTIGKTTYDMSTNQPLYTPNTKTGGVNVNPVAIRSPGGGTKAPTLGNYLTKGAEAATGLGKSALDSITGALGTTAGAAGAGALIASLLGNDFGGGTGNQNQGLDMSKVGVINPRTTDFGIGPTNFVGYEDYGTSNNDYTPNEELLRNLNAPGYNPVNEGDYGYEEVPAEAPKMASGGLSSMSTPVASYYTFGQPADILANLGMRPQPPMNSPDMMNQVGQQQPAQQAQQQGLPQQSPPMAQQQMSPTMPQQGIPQNGMMPQQQGMAPPMRKGGLPHVSNVPVVQGRMDFRNGSAVHGDGDGQSDDIPAMLADGEYVIDAETVAQIGNGSTKAGAQALDRFRESIRAHKRSAPVNKIPPKTKALTSYLKGAK